MKLRILFFEDVFSIRNPFCNILREHGYEVLGFPNPTACALVSNRDCACPRECACADLIITDLDMPKMTGVELIRLLKAKACQVQPQNMIIISAALAPEQKAEFDALGCHFLPKPFGVEALLELIRTCTENIPPERELIPIEQLWEPVAKPRRIRLGRVQSRRRLEKFRSRHTA